MQARFTVDAPADLETCVLDEITLNFELVCTGPVTVAVIPSDEIHWGRTVAAIENGIDVYLGRGFGSGGGFEIKRGVVTIMSPDGGGVGSVVTVVVPAADCLDAFRVFRDIEYEFMADPVAFARKHRDE